ncbi:InlB B-repeat-containing protein [Peptoniphilus grossensis]|uniref:InlB B-repeat-containing protein n=1 Tax=Peptoniphilus grossensis TaxID=1465756 RepID=UPI003991518B
MKNYLKRTTTFILALLMLLSVPLQAFAEVQNNYKYNYDNLTKDQAEIINKKEVKPAKLESGQTAEKLIENPKQPEIYTLRTDYKVQRGDKYEVDYQPYIASVGEAATQAEKDKVNKTIELPDLTGYEKPDDDYLITYDKVKNAGNNGSQEFRYKSKANAITIKHVFQDLHDFTKYTNPDGSVGEKGELITTQNGNTGSTMEVSPLNENERRGFVPEAPFITMQVPENAENFILEYRYNRAHYNVNFDTDGGTPVPDRTLYYEQIIPTIDDKSIPTKAGSDFLGWKPSHDLQTADGKTYKKNQIINKADGTPALDLDVKLKMPALLLGLDEKSREKLTFTAVWKDKPKAEYVIQFWTEKTDYDDKDNTLPLRDRYDFIGARRIDNADTGSTPDLTNLDIHGITFPDLNDGRLEKAQDNKEEFERYYFLNEDLTKKQNASKENPEVQKTVSSTGETVYNVYYDRRVYTLYFTAASGEAFDIVGSFWPIITREGQVIGREGSPYKVDVRFNQSLDKIWPKDEEVSNLPPDSSEKGVDIGLIGWTINNNAGEQAYRDTPPYRLSAEDFIDSQDVVGTGEFEGFGHSDQIPIKDGETKERDKYEISLGSTSYEKSVVHHIDIIKDDFEGKEQIDYDMSYWKSDTSTVEYPFGLPHLQGFTLKEEERPAEWIGLQKGRVGTFDAYKTFDELNAERNKKTPFRSDADKIEYIDKFPWGTKSFNGVNAYNYANYTRNKYKLKLNNDPKTVKNDSEYGAGNILDVPYELPLNDLKLDSTHKPIKPNWVRDDWDFLGWALDPAGDNLVKDGNETKLHYDQVLYAKWGEPNYKWKVIFDPNGGSLRTIDENKLTTELKTVKEGDIGQEKETTYPIKEANQAGKQVFTVIQKQKLIEPKFKPVRKGYDFMGWEIIRYKKNEQGDYTEEIDNSYREIYKVPELYSFGNDVVSPIYLKAIWVPNARVDIDVLHYYLDKDYNLDKNISPNPDPDKLENKRSGYLVATTGDRQDDKYTLVPHDELNEKLTGDLKTIYEEYNNRVGLNNSFFQTFRVEPAEIPDPEDSEKMIPNPDVKNNVFKFFYRPYRHREYKVNYIDESFKGKENEKDGAIIDQELVVNGNRHYDARNYRPIPGWVLTSAPQQQLFFDLNEETNELIGINGTGKDEITFYYKDVRVIEVPEGGKTPEGYVRVTFKADKGGSFGKDAEGNDITELHYDVIKGLKSDLLPVPQELKEGETADANKYYITPDDGKKFTKWDNKPLLNKNTIINENHTFTAYFEWSGLSASGLVRTEAFKDPNGKWTNDFAPKIEDLKKQLVWREKDVVEPLPEGTVIKLFDENDNELTTDDQVYDLVNEKKAADKDEVVRTVNIKAKVTFPDKKDPQELDIPITVYKNVYEALNKEGDKPLFLSEAEKKDAKDGGLKDILKENTENRYIKVTVKPNKDFDNKDDKVYYVNPNAWVEIPKVKTDGDSNFTNWTADIVGQNDDGKKDGIFDFGKRHKFTEDTIITPVGAGDVVEQTDPNKKPPVPDSYVKVIVDKTTKAELGTEEKQTQTFWVNPTKEVTIPVTEPTGKTDQEVDIPKLGKKKVNYVFNEWQKVKTGETDDSLAEVKPAEKIDLVKNKYTEKVTVIEASYFERFAATPIVKPIKTDELHTPEGKEITDKDLIDKITPPENKEIESVTVVERPDPSKPGKQEAKVTIKYKDGSTQGTNDNPVVIPVEVHKNIIPEVIPGQKPEGIMDNYVKVIFKAGTGGSLSGNLVYYVSPEVEVNMTTQAEAVSKNPSIGYTANGGSWSPEIKSEKITEEKTYEFNFVKSKDIVEKTNDPNQVIPEGYVKVTFKTEDANKGKLEGDKEVKIYYVNPKAGIKLKVLEEGQTAGEKELAVPKTLPAKNYVFDKWQEVIDEKNPITNEKEHVAMFQAGQVSLTYEKGGDDVTGDLPAKATAKYGEKVGLAGPGNLAKPNATFAGWKLDEDETIYQPGDQVTLEKARTATAQWTTAKHTVTFNTMGGSDVPKQEVVHGGKLTNVTPPTIKDKVFMGWKEEGKENEEAYFDLTSAINEDKTLIAIWQDPVQKIGENDTVEEQFIKVTFLKGAHGTLKEGQTDGIEKVTYKVAKDYDFDQAKLAGLEVPGIVPAKYYKEADANDGWDKALDLTLEANETEKIFTAQYEPEADVIPIDPNVTPDEKLQEDKPEGMVLVEFKVDPTKAFMTGTTKFYVKIKEPVNIETPVVHPLTLDNQHNDYVFKGWSMETEDENNKVSFISDTIIDDSEKGRPDIQIIRPMPDANNIIISVLTDEADGYLEITGDGIPNNTIIKASKRGRMNMFYIKKEIGRGLRRDDEIKIYAVKDGIKSEEREYRVK